MEYPLTEIGLFILGLLVGVAACRLAAARGRRTSDGAAVPSQAARPQPKAEPKRPAAPVRPPRSEALTLLATLQREARFVDFIKEPLEGYSDAQIGAVARDVHRDSAKVLDRLFALSPVASQQEGEELDVPAGFDPARYRLTGNVAGEPPFRGRLTHHGWEAARCDLPAWSGKEAQTKIVAPAEVELK